VSRLSERLYARLLGDDAAVAPTGGVRAPVSFGRLVYYAYKRGFWSLLRGTLHRWRLKTCGGRFYLGHGAQLLFPSLLSVGSDVAIGRYVYLNALSQGGVVLGDRVRLREFGWVQATSHLSRPGKGVTIGDDTYIGPHSVLGAAGGIVIGRGVRMGAYVQLLAENHVFADADQPIARQGVESRGIDIGDDCWLGNNAIVLDGVTVGRGAVVGAGAVVTRSVEPDTIVAGNPARVIGLRKHAG
jgi:acetyltransferase-like isoleucine patch superfamily enzyme